MMPPWKLHLVVFWVAFLGVCATALFAGWNATSGITEEETSYLLYECAFLFLLVVLGLLFVLGSFQISKSEKRKNEIENRILAWAVQKGWKETVWSDDLEKWIEQKVESEDEAEKNYVNDSQQNVRQILVEHRLLSDNKRNAWKKILGPTLQLVFLLTITSAAIPSSGWFLSTHHNINTISAIVVVGGSILATLYALSCPLFLYPRTEVEHVER